MTQADNADKKAGWLVVLGDKGGKCYKTQRHFFVKGGKWSAPFPVVVYVSTEEEANDVLSFEPAIRLMMRAEGLQEKVRLAMSLPGWDTVLGEYNDGMYPVVHGQRCGIYTQYNDAVESVNFTERPIWRKVAPFGRALAYMITKGESEKSTNKDWQDLLESLSQVRVSSPVQRAASQAPSPAPVPVPTPTPPPALSAPPTTPKKLQPGSVRWSAAEQDYVFSAPTSRSPAPTPATSQAVPAADIFEDATFNEYVFPPMHQAVNMGPGFVYQHVRTLRGIKSTHSAPVADRLATPSCGPAADIYLQALGYDVEAKLTVARELQAAVEMGDFVRKICSYGLPALEAKYIWYLYESDGPQTYWSYTHIM
ncbi:hypothetical protein OH76DRAFT_1484544 [Lentinus brumalis]|uniref:Uncharacterized protein n=1 Tax=Lentinus brumalis TaxID=2498619 RepID=A0A371D562_9APHY|nr:hypothetical protein OH76DRAFT_1484544 [Polyporus brumalis]